MARDDSILCDVLRWDGLGTEAVRCLNVGTHEHVWSGCPCSEKDPDVCLEDGWGSSWECDGPHRFEEAQDE